MPDIYLCGNGSDTGTDITLRGAAPCTSASTGGAGVFSRVLAPPRRLTSLVQVQVEVSGVGTISHTSSLTVTPVATHSASVGAQATTRLHLNASSTGAVTGASRLDVTARASGDDPPLDDLLLLLDLI